MISSAIFYGLAAIAVVGAAVVVFARDVMRMALGLGAFMLALAGFFAYYGFGLLALAELFLYVGGVLVLFLFAIMLVHRGSGGAPSLESRFDPLSLIATVTVSLMLFIVLRPVGSLSHSAISGGTPAQISKLLLGPLLPQFEAIGALLLAALVGVVVVMGGDRR
jgi:NADH-quinone oxidoreductase subunit J